MNYPEPQHLVDTIGKDTDDARVQAIFGKFGITLDQLRPLSKKLKGQLRWSDFDHGIHMGFNDVGLLKKIPYHDVDEGPWVLVDVAFWAKGESKVDYAGPLPFGLNFAMSRNEVKRHLSTNSLPDCTSYGDVDVWICNGVELAADFGGENGRIRCFGLAPAEGVN
ncbi:hypothetical protein E4A48_01290 [Xanthomonas cerealis pv. cerealis]|uniref:Uncharacterized protein n=1 Tax=Xanthomonas cerealis pv. cerealis TaxID=152263 RepID=A0A514E903_9XANT|nr:hypothetical protein [Xanthomonas translucens]QDI02514.1 hypothetical protein E4A48_01290 [Xanthomonas translucens pv. cerealis]